MGITDVSAHLDFDALRRRITGIQDKLRSSVCTPARQPGRADAAGHRPAEGPPRDRGRDGRRPGRARGRRRPAEHRQPAPHPRLGAGRRRPGAHHPRRLPAARAARAPRGGGLGRDRRRVRPHVLVLRLPGHPDREPPAGAAPEGPRGGRRPRGGLHRAAACASTRGPGPWASTWAATQVTVRCDDGRVATGSHALLAIGSLPNSERLGLDEAGRRRRRRLRGGQPQLPVQRAPHLRGRRPVGQAAAVVGGGHAGTQDRRARHGPARRPAPPPRLREGGVGHLHRARDRRRGPGRGRRLRRRAQDPGDQGAVLGQRQGPHRERPPRVRQDHLRPGHRAWCWAGRSWAATRPSSSR